MAALGAASEVIPDSVPNCERPVGADPVHLHHLAREAGLLDEKDLPWLSWLDTPSVERDLQAVQRVLQEHDQSVFGAFHDFLEERYVVVVQPWIDPASIRSELAQVQEGSLRVQVVPACADRNVVEAAVDALWDQGHLATVDPAISGILVQAPPGAAEASLCLLVERFDSVAIDVLLATDEGGVGEWLTCGQDTADTADPASSLGLSVPAASDPQDVAAEADDETVRPDPESSKLPERGKYWSVVIGGALVISAAGLIWRWAKGLQHGSHGA